MRVFSKFSLFSIGLFSRVISDRHGMFETLSRDFTLLFERYRRYNPVN